MKPQAQYNSIKNIEACETNLEEKNIITCSIKVRNKIHWKCSNVLAYRTHPVSELGCKLKLEKLLFKSLAKSSLPALFR